MTLESTWLARSTRSSELVHHGGGTMPPVRGGGAVVLTIHDLQFLSIPEYFSPLKLRYLRAMVPRSARAATVVAVPSAYVGSTVVERLGVDPDRVVVVPHGVGEELGARATPRDDLVRRFSLRPGRVIVYPAVTHPHKGHALLLDAVAELVHRRGLSDLQLVLTGGSGAAEADVQRAIERHGLGDNVVRTGRVNDDDRDGLIVMADALVFPSEYEGFGAPIIEAMRLGTPVVSSDQPAVVEVGGGAAIVAEREPDAWVDAILDAFDRPDELRSAGRERAAAFDVRASGDALAAAYDLALSIAGSRAGGER